MIEINSSKIDKNLLENKIEDIIEILEREPKKIVEREKRESKKTYNNETVYTVEDFTKYHDVEFIENVYKKVLLREVDQETLNRELELLRSGKKSKSEILSTVRFSKEGREKGVHILGIKKRFIMTLLNRIPVINIFVKIVMLPRFVNRLNGLEALYLLNQKNQNDRMKEIMAMQNSLKSEMENVKNSLKLELENIKNNIKLDIKTLEDSLSSEVENIKSDLNLKIDNFKNSLKSEIDNNQYRIEHIKNSLETRLSELYSIEKNIEFEIDELKYRIKEIRRAKEQLVEIERNIANLLDNIKGKNINYNSENIVEDVINVLEKEKSSNFDELYISFEDKFRGKREDIKKRHTFYLPIVKNIIKNPDEELIIDIGCGRGEWLELLKDNSFKAKGVDLNRLMVKESKELGLDIVNMDGIEFLKTLKDNSVTIITAFHVVEHLPFEVLISLFDESYRVLKSGGSIIFETPNPENLMVGSNTFYTDPTHKNPIPPVTLEFLAKNRGFKDVEIHRLHPVKKPSFVNIENSEDINNLIFASTKAQDYSIVGLK